MASIVSKLARAAVATRRASPSAVAGIAGGGRPILLCSPRRYQTGGDIRVSPAGGPNSEEEDTARPKSEVAPHASIKHPTPHVDENVLKSDEAMWAFYEYWCKFHGISRDRREMVRRFKIFSNNARAVYKFNNSGLDGRLGMTKFADWTKEERKVLLGYRRAKR